MKHLISTLIFVISFSTFPQENTKIIGDWNGAIGIPNGGSIKLAFHITEEDGKLKTTFDSPDQGAFGLAMDETSFKDGVLVLKMKAINAFYEGKLKEEKLEGKWSQNGQSLELNLTKEKKK